ncbi:MAG: adenylyl-sulfate kinase [Rhodospirillaceae bacterium]|nr:adenylyl-sulfate kinase [Rhodospirillaceae bacterium]
MTTPREALRIVIVGHVDHGKSTLVGRLFYDTGSLPEGRFEAIQDMCRRRGMPFEWAFLTDALQAERDQGITIDTTQVWFRTPKRETVIIDAPGHKQFLKNMVTGAASAEAALLIIDAEEGMREQSRRHGYLLHLLGISQVAVVVNKMDRVGYSRERFVEVERDCASYLSGMGVVPSAMVPVSAREGDNIAERSANMPWYDGPTVIEALDDFHPMPSAADLPLRMPIQDVYRFDDRRIFAGRVESGILRVGDTVMFSPSNRTAKVKTIEAWSADQPIEVRAGQSVGFTLDDQLFVERGEVVSHTDSLPVETNVFRARIFWLDEQPMVPGRAYKIKLNTTSTDVRLQSVEKVIDSHDLSSVAGDRVEQNAVAEVVLRGRTMLALDEHATNPRMGRFVITDNYRIVGGGIISMEGYPDQRQLITSLATNITQVEKGINAEVRWSRNGHRGGVLWFTGLSGAGKSTVALAVERELFRRGYHVYVLDGDNVRAGLNANLGFSPEERAENIRRVGEAAALFADAGFIVVTAFISPYRSDRDRAREAAMRVVGEGAFHEIHIDASLAVCEQRDPKGLYKRARTGDIRDFTGISAPYEAPDAPELTVSTDKQTVEESVAQILGYVDQKLAN